jgi:hypothetical protein
MTDTFATAIRGLESPAYDVFAITPANEDLATLPRALWVDAPGDLVIPDVNGDSITLDVPAGIILPIRPKQVRTGTTAVVMGLV